MKRAHAGWLALLLSPLSCSQGPRPASGGPAASPVCPTAASSTATAFAMMGNPQCVVAQLGCVSTPGAILARVRTSNGSASFTTPYTSLGPNGVGAVSVLGLAPATTYSFSLETLTAGGVSAGPTILADTPALPLDLAALQITTTGMPSSPSGYYLVSGGGNYTTAFDRSGTVRWYRRFDTATQEAKMHADGTFTTFVGTSTGSEAAMGSYVRYTPDGTTMTMYSAASPDTTDPALPVVYTDPHELLITVNDAGDERVHFIGYALRPRSATDATVAAWHQLQRLTPEGAVEFRWKTSDYFAADDEILGGVVNNKDIDHANAIDIDPRDGNYVLSLRNFNALVKVDYTTGDVIWQFGGKKNQFTILNDPLDGFQTQHSVRILPNGNVLLYDDGPGHTPPESRAVEYRLDTSAMTATMVWEFRHSPAIFTPVTGSVERLENGNTLVAFAFAGTTDEVDADGRVLWEAQITKAAKPLGTYRVRRLPSLYAFTPP